MFSVLVRQFARSTGKIYSTGRNPRHNLLSSGPLVSGSAALGLNKGEWLYNPCRDNGEASYIVQHDWAGQ